jgi:hypothetical protein
MGKVLGDRCSHSSLDVKEMPLPKISHVSHVSHSPKPTSQSCKERLHTNSNTPAVVSFPGRSQSPESVLGDRCSLSSLDCESKAFPTPPPTPSQVSIEGGSSLKSSEFINAFARPTEYRKQSSQVGKKRKTKGSNKMGIVLMTLAG